MIVKKAVWLISFFLGVTTTLWSQEYYLLEGRVSHPRLSLEGIHVINSTRGGAEITDAKGVFSISVQLGETLVFSAIQFKRRDLYITEETIQSKDLIVYLDAFVTELDEVVVKPHNLSGNLASDLNSSTSKPTLNFKDVGIPGFEGVRKEKIVSGKSLLLSTLLLPISGGINIEAVYKHLSGYYESLKKKRANQSQFNFVVKAIEFYGVYFFIENYNLDIDQVYDFVLGCAENSDIAYHFKINAHQNVINAFDAFHKERYVEN